LMLKPSEIQPVGRFRAALSAFEALNEQLSRSQHHNSGLRLGILTMCWGRGHARRLPLWLYSLKKVDVLNATLVVCLDTMALDACRSSHTQWHQCADARDWPQNSFSKLSAIAMCLSRNIDVLWLDDDVIVLQNPANFLEPISISDSPTPSHEMEMMFSVEADSWNCVNTGVFFMRATAEGCRFLGVWASLLLDRPVSSDQQTLYLLLGLLPDMDYRSFCDGEGLGKASSPRARLFGPLRTPRWGALDSRRKFVVPFEAVYGGVEVGHVKDVVVFHMLDSWPSDAVATHLYDDIRTSFEDPVFLVLQKLAEKQGGKESALEIVKRSERGWIDVPGSLGGRRDCRNSYSHGR